MTSKQRVFSNPNNLNYNEYIKNKQGVETLKTIKYNSENMNINRFNNYDQFIIFSKSYYKYKDLNCCETQPTKSLYNSNISYINKNKKVNDCNCSKKSSLETDEHTKKYNECNLLKQVLYPYGHYESNKVSNMYFPYKINLDNWCLKKKQCEYPFPNNNDNKDNNYDNKKCKTGLCGNTKPLFI